MIQKHINKICFIFLNILVFVIFLPWLKGHYATDSYNIINVGYEYYSIHNSLVDGRVFMFLIMQLAETININFELLHFILLFLALLVSNVSVVLIKNIITDHIEIKNVKTEIFSYIVAYTFIYNFMYIENLYFLECFVMSIGILLNIIAAKIFAKKGQLYLAKTALFALLSIFCYQGTISSFIAFLILLEALKKQPLKSFIKNVALGIIITGVACICNFAFVKIISNYLDLQQIRLNNSIIQNILYILQSKLQVLIHLSNEYFYGLFLPALILLITLFANVFNFKDNKQKYVIFFIFLILGTIFCTDLPYTISLTAFCAARTRFAIGALFSMIVIYIFTNSNKLEKGIKKTTNYFLAGFVIIYFVLNILNYVEIIYSSKMVNKCEKEYVLNIAKYINNYEKENNTIIEKIQLVYSPDANNAFFPNCVQRNYVAWNACSCLWSAVGTINYYSNRNLIPVSSNYIEIKMDEMYKITDDVLYVKIAII